MTATPLGPSALDDPDSTPTVPVVPTTRPEAKSNPDKPARGASSPESVPEPLIDAVGTEPTDDEVSSPIELLLLDPKSGLVQVPTPRPTVDRECLDRVEQTLDETELAIGLLEEQDRRDQADVILDSTDAPAIVKTKPGVNADTLVSVVMPVYNERTTIREIVRRVQAVDMNLELIIVDDYSLDGTRPILFELEKEYDNVRLLLQGYNQGKGAALRTGFQRAKGDVVIVQDADLEYDPSDYPKLIKPILEGRADVVYGSRFLGDEPRDPSWLHRFGNGLLTWASNLMTGQRLTDMETCYKVFRRRVLNELEIEQNRFGCEPEITAKISRLGHKIHEAPIRYNGRGFDAGKKIGMKDAFVALWCIVRYRFVR